MCTRARACGWQVGGVDVAIGPFLRNTIHAAPFFPSSTPTTVYVAAAGSNALEICGLTVDGRPPDDSYPGGVCSGACPRHHAELYQHYSRKWRQDLPFLQASLG